MARIAIVAVHGIGPAQRYALQEEVADNLAERLPGTWSRGAFFPPGSHGTDPLGLGPAVRLERKDTPPHADDVTFDVYEAYWSPIDKNRTSFVSVLSWLLNALFAPLNATTPLPAKGKKLAFDLAFVLTAMALVVLLPLTTLISLAFWSADFVTDAFYQRDMSLFDAVRTVTGPHVAALMDYLPWMLVTLLAGAIGWYTLGHVLASIWQSRKLRQLARTRFGWQYKMRLSALIAGSVLLGTSWFVPVIVREHFLFRWEPLMILAAVGLGRVTLGLTHDFFVNRIGDIQIYTVGDHNSGLFDLRYRILGTVNEVILRVLLMREDLGRPLYDRIYIVAHSLGSTIAMDSLIRIYQAVEAGDLPRDAWERIRGFVTLGTALEKTRFFFNVGNTTVTESYQHWRGDVYGKLFSDDPSILTAPPGEHAIFWANYWYLRDVVANEITTYDRPARDGTDRTICYNVRLRERGASVVSRPWVHSDYLGDDCFWNGIDYHDEARVGVLDVVRSGFDWSGASGFFSPAAILP